MLTYIKLYGKLYYTNLYKKTFGYLFFSRVFTECLPECLLYSRIYIIKNQRDKTRIYGPSKFPFMEGDYLPWAGGGGKVFRPDQRGGQAAGATNSPRKWGGPRNGDQRVRITCDAQYHTFVVEGVCSRDP